MKVSEIEIAKCVIEYLESLGWDVYQEVKVSWGGRCADIVGVLGNRTWVVETKTTFNLTVMEQAFMWTRLSNYVSVAVPSTQQRSGARDFARLVCQDFGIGVMYAGRGYDGSSVRVMDSPKLKRFNDGRSREYFFRNNLRLRGTLCSEHKTFALAGNANGKHWSPFKATCQRVVGFVRKNPGCSLKEVISSIDHHYCNDSSAYGSLLHWIADGKIDGLIVDTTKRPFRYYTPDYKYIQLVNFRLMIYEDIQSGVE